MSDFTDDIVDGFCCELCGIYFTEPHGYPVVCQDCWANMTDEERESHQVAIHEEV